MDSKKISLLTLCDLSKAFDSVSRSILFSKCADLNIDSFWFKVYVSKITQSVRLNNTKSSIQNIAYGVPQGSILGPILFNIYVNEVAYHITDCLLVQYADETSSSTRALSTTLTFLSETLNQLSLDLNATF